MMMVTVYYNSYCVMNSQLFRYGGLMPPGCNPIPSRARRWTISAAWKKNKTRLLMIRYGSEWIDRSSLSRSMTVAREMKFSHLSLLFFILICIVGRYQAQRPAGGVQNVLNIFRQVFRRPNGGTLPINNNQQQSVSVSTVFAFPEGAYPISTAVETVCKS